MNCVVAIEGRFVLNQGKPASHHLTYDRFWRRYLEVFDAVTVVGRLYPIETAGCGPVEGAHVSFFALPGYVGPFQYLIKSPILKKRLAQIYAPDSAFILRVPGMVGTTLWFELRKHQHPYGVEVVGDPYDVFAPGAVRHPLRFCFRWWFPRQLRRQCTQACAAAYVTEHTLQYRYPPAPTAFTTNYSSVELPSTALVSMPRRFGQKRQPPTLITVGSLTQLHKGTDTLIEAMAVCAREGLELRLIVVGEGKHRPELEAHARKLGLGDAVDFLGQLPAGEVVRAQLDAADLLVLPSRQEGLPRAMIEAMARALPCIGSTVGGIPELLPPEDMVPPDDVEGLARKIRGIAANPERMTQMSVRNLGKAQEYRKDLLQERRKSFYQHVRQTTEAWVKATVPYQHHG